MTDGRWVKSSVELTKPATLTTRTILSRSPITEAIAAKALSPAIRASW